MTSATGLYLGFHELLAKRWPEMRMGEPEAKLAMGAAQNVLRHYDIKTTQKTLDWAAAVMVAGTLYIPRFQAIGSRRRGERAPPAAPSGATGLGLSPAGNGAAESLPMSAPGEIYPAPTMYPPGDIAGLYIVPDPEP